MASGILDRWCKVQLTYCKLAQEHLAAAENPAVAAQLSCGGSNELVVQMMADHMSRFKVIVMLAIKLICISYHIMHNIPQCSQTPLLCVAELLDAEDNRPC